MPKQTPLLSCLSASLLFLYIIFQMTVFNASGVALTQQFGLSSVAIGNVSSIYFYCAALALIPYGLLLDHWPSRGPGLVIMGLCVAATVGLGIWPSLLMLGGYRAVCGLTNPLIFLICMRQAPMWFPRKISVAIGLMITVGMLGGMMEYPFSLIVAAVSWQAALLMDAGLGLVLFGFAFLFLQDLAMPRSHKQPQLWLYFKKALSVKENFLCGLFTGCLNLPVLLLGATWGDRYLMSSRGLSGSQASLAISMIFFGMIFASPFFGWFADFCRSRRAAMLLGSLASIFIMLAIVLIHTTHVVGLAALFFWLGFMCTSQIISYTVVNEVNSRENTSTAMSLVSILIYGIAAIANPLFGEVVKASSVDAAILILPIAFGLSLMSSLFITA